MKRWIGLLSLFIFATLLVGCQFETVDSGEETLVMAEESEATLTPFQPEDPTPTIHPTVTARPTFTPTATLTPTEVVCQETQGQVIESQMQPGGFTAPLEFTLYLPPCYEENAPQNGYPLVTLIHGQTYTPHQWVDIGLPEKMDQLIIDGEIEPYLVVMPYESEAYSGGLHTAIVADLIPYLQEEYRVCSGRSCNAIGGISRGGGWALTAAFKNPDFFISLGLHSTPTSSGHLELVRYSAAASGVENLPRIWLDFGESDYWFASEQDLVDTFDSIGIVYDFSLNEGGHDNTYWEAHLLEYLRWYAKGW